MGILAVAIDQGRRFPLVVAARRDALHTRPATRLAWWTPPEGGPAVLSGRDLEGGGSWLGLTAFGRLAAVTTAPAEVEDDEAAPSRGRIVTDWLAARERADRFWMRVALSGYNRFNLLAADFTAGECFHARNDGSMPFRLERGVHGLADGEFDPATPAVQSLKAVLRDAAAAPSIEEVTRRAFAALAAPASATAGPAGAPADALGRAAAVASQPRLYPASGYGSRCATLIITERVGRSTVTHVVERSFDTAGAVILQRHAALRHWPPRRGLEAAPAVETGPVSEGAAVDSLPNPRSRSRREPQAV